MGQRQFTHPTPFRQRRGLTFGEMLVVCAVFLILAVVFIFSSQTAMVKTRLSRVVQEQRLVARALDAYEADHGYPPSEAHFYVALNKSYIDKVPNDPFSEHHRTSSQYHYLAGLSERHKWVVISVGPDGSSDLLDAVQALRGNNVMMSSGGISPSGVSMLPSDVARNLLIEHSYDPTNGTVSRGDVITIYGN